MCAYLLYNFFYDFFLLLIYFKLVANSYVGCYF